jgi:Zn ribbon nucleic-acid-binding protein
VLDGAACPACIAAERDLLTRAALDGTACPDCMAADRDLLT